MTPILAGLQLRGRNFRVIACVLQLAYPEISRANNYAERAKYDRNDQHGQYNSDAQGAF